MTKHIGIVSVSYEGAALCYRSICEEAAAVMGEYHHPQITIHSFIFEELVKGALEKSTREYFRNVVADLAKAGCDGVVMACTEIPLLLTSEDADVPLLDSTRLLAKAALEEALRGALKKEKDTEGMV